MIFFYERTSHQVFTILHNDSLFSILYVSIGHHNLSCSSIFFPSIYTYIYIYLCLADVGKISNLRLSFKGRLFFFKPSYFVSSPCCLFHFRTPSVHRFNVFSLVYSFIQLDWNLKYVNINIDIVWWWKIKRDERWYGLKIKREWWKRTNDIKTKAEAG